MSLTLYYIGRFLLGAAFFVFGIRNVANIDKLTATMEKKGLLPQPRLFMMAGVGIQIVGGLMVATGVLSWLGALGLAVFLIAAAFLFHDPRDFPPGERTPHMNAWIMNLGLSGAFLMVMAASF